MAAEADKPKTADGKEFVLGMTLYKVFPGGQVGQEDAYLSKYETSPDSHCIDSFQFEGSSYHGIGRPGTGASTDLRGFFSTPEAAVADAIVWLERDRKLIDDRIAEVKALLAT